MRITRLGKHTNDKNPVSGHAYTQGDFHMTTYIALLRGINVGGKHIIKMAALKEMFEALGFEAVQTFIQSGNVLFRSDEAEEPLRKTIEEEIEQVFGFSVIVVLRTAEELAQIILHCPFTAEEIALAEVGSDSEILYVALLPQPPLPEKVERVDAYRAETEAWHVIGRDVYLLFQKTMRNSKLADNLHRLEVPATMRNWKTLTKLLAMAKAMEQ